MPIRGEGAASDEAMSVHAVGERLNVHAPNLPSDIDEHRVAQDDLLLAESRAASDGVQNPSDA